MPHMHFHDNACDALVKHVLAKPGGWPKADLVHQQREVERVRWLHEEACRRYRAVLASGVRPEVYEAWCPVRGEAYTRVYYPDPLRQARAGRRMAWRDLVCERRVLQAYEEARHAARLARRTETRSP